MKRLEISCLGRPSVTVDGQVPAPDVVWRKHLALLVYLALSPGRRRERGHLVRLLWSEKTTEQARHSLNEALHRLRSCLGAERLLSEGETIALQDADLALDLWRFSEAAGRRPERAVALIRGDFLEGLVLDDAPAFEEWVDGERARFRGRAVEVLVAHGEQLLAAGVHSEALAAGRRALAVNPLSEPATQLVMRASALSGDGAGALLAYHAFSNRLAAEVGELPSRAMTSLSDRIRDMRWRGGPGDGGTDEPPLVGRAAQLRDAYTLLSQGLRSGPRTLLITGDPGMGKSRLLAECAGRLRLEGAVVAVGRPLAHDADIRWSLLRQLLRGGLLGAPGLMATDPEALGIVVSLMPVLAERASPGAVRDVAQIASALQSVLAAVADEKPLALLMDDLQNADDATLDALGAALAQLSGIPVVVVAAAGTASDAWPQGLLRFFGDVGRRLAGRVVRLEPLQGSELRELVTAMAAWCDGPERDRLARRIAAETAGSPFLAVTLLRALRSESVLRDELLSWPPEQRPYEPPPFSVPEVARLAIVVRFSGLDAECRELLLAASVGGGVLDLDLVAALSRTPRGRLEGHLATLEREHFLQFNGERYLFAAPLIAKVLRGECLTRGRIAALRESAIALLDSRTDLESRVTKAELRAASEPGPGAYQEATTVAREALADGARRYAARAVAAARLALESREEASSAGLAELETALEE